MPTLRDFIAGPWRAVLVLGVTQIITWGTLFYPPVLTVPLIAAERGWSVTFAMGGFSLGLLTAGLALPHIGRLIDRRGGHVVMPAGSLLAATGLVTLVVAEHPATYLAVWMLLGVAIAASLYDAAFATLGRIFGGGCALADHGAHAGRRLCLDGELADDLSADRDRRLARHLPGLCGSAGAACGAPCTRLRCRVCGPILVRPPAGTAAPALPAHGWAFAMVAAAFAAYAFVPSGLSAHLLAIFGRAGLDAGTVVAIGALFGPAQVVARICELVFARGIHPLVIARLAVGLLLAGFALVALFGVSVAVAATFMVMFGMANGLITIARGTVPLALFGPFGYGALIGRIAGPCLVMQAIAPLVLAFVAERASDPAALGLVATLALLSFACLALLRPPRLPPSSSPAGGGR